MKIYVYALFINKELFRVCKTEEYAQEIKKVLEENKKELGTSDTFRIEKVLFHNF